MDQSSARTTETDTGKQRLSRRKWLRRVLIGGAAGLGYYGWRVEPHWVEVVHRVLPIPNLPTHLEGKSLVQISDIHIGRYVDDNFFIHWFQEVAKWEPDFVVFTGDFLTIHFDGTLPIEQMKKVLEHFPQGRSATIGILGNHDYGDGWESIEDANTVTALARDCGLDILRNSTKTFDGLQVIGFDDYWSPRFGGATVLENVDLNRPSLVLCHNPDVVDLPIWRDYRGWILSGHTHGGQCKSPFFTPPRLPIENKRYSAGEFHLEDGRRLYVNRALGHSWPVRFNVRPEITVFHLTANSQHAA